MSVDTDVLEWRGRTVVDRNGDKVGKLEEIYLDTETKQPEWGLVNTGLFGTKSSFVPLTGAEATGDDVRVAYEKDQVKDAPSVDPDGQLSQDEEAQLYRHYGLEYSTAGSETGLPEGTPPTDRGETDADAESGPREGTASAGRERRDADDADSGGGLADQGETVRGDAMTRSEEEVEIGTAERERGRARLKKYVVTEDVEETVPVRREEARVEREPITDENVDQAMSGPDITESEHEVTLHEEEPVVEKRTVPKERIRLETDVETDEEQVSETVRKERVEVEGDR
jgi:uncharacterized protein (TIGR02271 family)